MERRAFSSLQDLSKFRVNAIIGGLNKLKASTYLAYISYSIPLESR